MMILMRMMMLLVMMTMIMVMMMMPVMMMMIMMMMVMVMMTMMMMFMMALLMMMMMVEVNCETDFVSKGEKFAELGKAIAMQVAASTQVEFVSMDEIDDEVKERERKAEMMVRAWCCVWVGGCVCGWVGR